MQNFFIPTVADLGVCTVVHATHWSVKILFQGKHRWIPKSRLVKGNECFWPGQEGRCLIDGNWWSQHQGDEIVRREGPTRSREWIMPKLPRTGRVPSIT